MKTKMRKKIVFLIVFIFCMGFNYCLVFAASNSSEYLCETGIKFYKTGRYNDALNEFKKALLVDPANQTARQYIDKINLQQQGIAKSEIASSSRQGGTPRNDIKGKIPLAKPKPLSKDRDTRDIRDKIIEQALSQQVKSDYQPQPQTKQSISRDELVSRELNKYSGEKWGIKEIPLPQDKPGVLDDEKYKYERLDKEEECLLEIAGVKVRGEAQVRMGLTSKDAVWKQANWDLNEAVSEKNTRMLSNNALDRTQNTYDPRIYDRIKVLLDTDNPEGLDFHTNITVDPWSFTGKSPHITALGNNNDTADVELKYWSNTGYTLNETIHTNGGGNTLNLPEVKVKDNKIDSFSVSGDLGGTFSVPSLKIERQFQPFREFWLDYKQEGMKIRFFPIAYANQALTFDDPLQLSNKHLWWEDSPWIHRWRPGNRNTLNAPDDFTKGYWDNSLSFAVRDSESQRLVGLRGFSFDFTPVEGTTFQTNVAAPKDPWQDYAEVDNFLSASRLKQSVADNFDVGASGTTRMGYDVDNGNELDARNYVVAADAGYEISDGIKATVEIAHSDSKYDMSDSDFESEKRGNAYHFSLLGRYPFESIMHTQYGYDGIQREKEEPFFNKFRFLACHIDEGFDQPLSSYNQTRGDQFWGRHLHFRTPLRYYAQGERKEDDGLVTWDDIKGSRIGDGIDVARDTLGLRIESSLWDKKVENLFDVRNVHSSEGKFIENVTQDQLDVRVNDQLLFKTLGIYQKMPKTVGGRDSFIFDSNSGKFFNNNDIADGKNASLKTGSLGLEYSFFDWLSVNGIYERTNDYYVGYANTPQSVLWNRSGGASTYIENGKIYREVPPIVYSQLYFPQPPYDFYNIYSTGINIKPLDNLDIYLDYTCNEYKNAGPIGSTMNHIGCEMSYSPMEKMAIFLKYTYSRWKDVDQLATGDIIGHSNLFAEFMYRMSKDEDFVLQYGEGSRDPYQGDILNLSWDPYGGSIRTLDTQHIFRIYYRRRF